MQHYHNELKQDLLKKLPHEHEQGGLFLPKQVAEASHPYPEGMEDASLHGQDSYFLLRQHLFAWPLKGLVFHNSLFTIPINLERGLTFLLLPQFWVATIHVTAFFMCHYQEDHNPKFIFWWQHNKEQPFVSIICFIIAYK